MIYVRTTMKVPELGTVIHVAELEELDTQTCRMHRLLEIQDAPVVSAIPTEIVPHPSGYDSFPDIDAEILEEAEFLRLWEKAQA